MAKISLLEQLKRVNEYDLVFTSMTSDQDKEGNFIAILQLQDPIPMVRGSQEIILADGRKFPITKQDVTEIKVHQDNVNEDFVWDTETETGTYKGSSLRMDVSKSGDAWLVKQSFKQSGNDMRNKFRNDRLEKIVGTVTAEGRAAKKETSNVEPVNG